MQATATGSFYINLLLQKQGNTHPFIARLAGGKWIQVWTDWKEAGTESHTEPQICAADLLSTVMFADLKMAKVIAMLNLSS